MSATPRTLIGAAMIAPLLLFPALTAPLAAAVPTAPVAGAPNVSVLDPALPRVRLNTDGGVVSVRSGPATDKRAMAVLGDDAQVTVRCKVWGEQIAGTERRGAHWVRVGPDRYLPEGFLAWPAPFEVPWCGADAGDGVTARADTGGSVLNVRREPDTRAERLGAVADGRPMAVQCQAEGEIAGGSRVWLRLPGGRYVAAAFVRWAPQRPWLPWCGQEPVGAAPASSRDFVADAAGPARAAAREFGVPASVLVAQAADASDWGRAAAARRDHNYFATPCPAPGDPGGMELGCRAYGGTDLRAYRDRADSFAEHAALLAGAPQHRAALARAGDPEGFVRELQAAGYPGGARQADRIVELIRRYDLHRFDAPS